MKIGVSLTTTWPPSLDAREAGKRLIERARTAREAGLDSLFVGDHHMSYPNNYFQNVPTIARLMAETGDLMVGALFLMPLHNPVVLAEQIGTLAALAAGPFVTVAALGGREDEFTALGVPFRQRPSRLEENLTIVRRLLSGEAVTFAGRYHKLDGVSIAPVPKEPPEIWMAATSRVGVERAARMADGWLAGPGDFGEEMHTRAAVYRQAASADGKQPRLVIRRDVYVGESNTEAEETTAGERGSSAHGSRAISFRPESQIVGGPERVIEEFKHLHAMGFEHVLIRSLVQDQTHVLSSYRRLGEYVLPAIRNLQPA